MRVPKWGLTIESVQVVAWFKGLGDQVGEGDVLCEVETDKANAEIEAPTAGVLDQIVVDVGEKTGVGEVVCYLRLY